MRILIRVLGGLVALLVLAGVALAVMLPRLVGSEGVRTRIVDAARDATGREFSYGELDVGILPPRLLVTEARLAGETDAAAPMLESADVQLRLALMPLLARSVVVDSLVVEGATLRLVRTAEGIELPEPEPEAEAATGGQPQPEPAREAAPAAAESGDMALAVRRIDLRDVRLVLEDRAVTPPVTWDLGGLDAEVRGRSLDEPLDVDLSATLASGGRFDLRGRVTPGGSLDLAVDLREVDLAPAAPYLGDGRKVAGRVSGSVAAKGETPDNPSLVVDLRLADADVVLDDLTLTGGARIEADLEQVAAPTGRFAIDATDAVLGYGGAFTKPAGTTATVDGRVTTAEDGAVVLEGTRVRMKNLDAQLRLETGARTRARIDADPFALEGWDALLPALAETPVKGKLGFEALEVATGPLALGGRVRLDGLRVPQSESGELLLRGALVGDGGAVRSEDLVASFAGQELKLDLSLTDLERKPRLQLKSALEDADSNTLLATLADKPDVLSGPLDVDADLALPLTGGAPVTSTIRGTVRFSIEPGRLKGVSLLRSAFQRFGAFGEAAVLAGRVKGGRTLQRFYDDEFQSLAGTLRLGGGAARTDDLRLVYRNYRVDLKGSVGLADQSLDLGGTLTMDEEVDAALQGETAEGQQPAAIPEGGSPRRRSRTLSLARVTGTLENPQVVLTRDAVVAFATRTGSIGRRRDELSRKIDERLGEGSGEQVLDVLEGILGGRNRR